MRNAIPYIKPICENVNSAFLNAGASTNSDDYLVTHLPKENFLVDNILKGHCINDHRITMSQSSLFFYIIYKIAKNSGYDTQITHAQIKEVLLCSIRNITKIVRRLEELELITVDRVTMIKDGAPRTSNFYNINWIRAKELLGHKIYGSACAWKHAFIQSQLMKAYTLVKKGAAITGRMFQRCRNFVQPSYSYNIDIYNIDMKNEAIKKADPGALIDLLKADHLPITRSSNTMPAKTCTLFPAHLMNCPTKWCKIATDKGMNDTYIEKEFQYVKSFWVKMGDTSYAQKADWTEMWSSWIDRVKNNPKTTYKFMPDFSPPKTKLLSKRYCWNKNHDIPPEWRVYIDNHGGFINEVEKTLNAFGTFYSTRTEIIRTDEQWFDLWKRWVDTRQKPIKEKIDVVDDVHTTEGTIQHDIRVLVGDHAYRRYFMDIVLTPTENDVRYTHNLKFAAKNDFIKGRYSILLRDLKIYVL